MRLGFEAEQGCGSGRDAVALAGMLWEAGMCGWQGCCTSLGMCTPPKSRWEKKIPQENWEDKKPQEGSDPTGREAVRRCSGVEGDFPPCLHIPPVSSIYKKAPGEIPGRLDLLLPRIAPVLQPHSPLLLNRGAFSLIPFLCATYTSKFQSLLC